MWAHWSGVRFYRLSSECARPLASMAPPHGGVALMAAVAAAALLLALDAAVASGRLMSPPGTVKHGVSEKSFDRGTVPFTMSVAEPLNTLKVLQAFAAAMPSLGWSGDDFCSWSGVRCLDANVSIVVSGSWVTGTLPEMPDDVDYSMVKLSEISIFGQRGGITGTLPDSWGKLREVRTISLGFISVSGTLPAAWSSMAAIEQIAVATTQVTGTLPEAWSTMPKLRRIYVVGCNLYGSLPESWAQMPSLERLSLRNNNFCGCVPVSWLRSATLLMGVDARHRMGNCSTAQACVETSEPDRLISSSSTSTTAELGRHSTTTSTTMPPRSTRTTEPPPALEYQCNVSNCTFCVLDEVARCSACSDGYVLTDEGQCMQNSESLEAKRFTTREAERWNTLKVLQAFAAAMPSLGWSGDDFCSWSGVMCFNDNVSISLTRSWVTGTLPEMPDDVDYSMVKLDQISIFGQHSGITGTLPSSWGKLHNMRAMGLRFISISGTLPASWSMMAAIEQIVIFSTQVTGTLPESWARMPSIQHLNLHENYFCGCVPTSWLTSPTLLMGVEARHRTENCSTAEACVDTTTPVPVGSSRTTRSRVQRTKSL